MLDLVEPSLLLVAITQGNPSPPPTKKKGQRKKEELRHDSPSNRATLRNETRNLRPITHCKRLLPLSSVRHLNQFIQSFLDRPETMRAELDWRASDCCNYRFRTVRQAATMYDVNLETKSLLIYFIDSNRRHDVPLSHHCPRLLRQRIKKQTRDVDFKGVRITFFFAVWEGEFNLERILFKQL
jgi:hypothetical protein